MKKFNFLGDSYDIIIWDNSVGFIGNCITLDTETENIENGKTPKLVIGQVFDGKNTVYIFTNEATSAFMELHKNSTFILMNAAFDIDVINTSCNFNFDYLIRNNKIIDIGILYRLVKLATEGFVPERWGLAAICDELLGLPLDKQQALRTNWNEFLLPHGVDINSIPNDKLIYAATDVVATQKCHEILQTLLHKIQPKFNLSHKIQLMGSIALKSIEKNGIGFDLIRKDHLLTELNIGIKKHLNTLSSFNYIPGTKGIKKILKLQLERIESEYNIQFPRTAKKNEISANAEILGKIANNDTFANAFLKHQELAKVATFIKKNNTDRLFPCYKLLVNTGRTASNNPNVQNLPRTSGVRECYVPGKNNVFIAADYSTIELRTLAQVTYTKFGFSKMREIVNSGIDLHKYLAAQITNKPIEEITKEERQKAKAANFGIPGGMAARSFRQYAEDNYGVKLTEEETNRIYDAYFKAFPEVKLYLRHDLMNTIDFKSSPFDDENIAFLVFQRIVSGKFTRGSDGMPYSNRTIRWVFEDILPKIDKKYIGLTRGSENLRNEILNINVTTLTGRIRANCEYCESKNTAFQGIAADGAKIALYRLMRANYKIVAFIHDEVIIEIPSNSNFKAVGGDIENIMISAMANVVPDVNIAVEWVVMDRWYKDAQLMHNTEGNTEGNIIPFSKDL